MGIMHCGVSRSGRYCPECGEKLLPEEEGSLGYLLAHCRSTTASFDTMLKQLAGPDMDGYKSKEHWKKRVKSIQRARDKWQSWSQKLSEILYGEQKDAS